MEELQSVNAQLPRFGGRVADALAGLGMMRQPDVFRLQAEQVREQVLGIFRTPRGGPASSAACATRSSRSRWGSIPSRSSARVC